MGIDKERLIESGHRGPEFDTSSGAEVLIIDVGAQYRMRFHWELAEMGVRTDMVSYTFDPEQPNTVPFLDVEHIKQNYKAVHITGGGGSVDDGKTPPLPPELLDGSIAVWGNCLGAQLITQSLGGEVAKSDAEGNVLAEYGQRTVKVSEGSVIFGDDLTAAVHMSHSYGILGVPDGCHPTSYSKSQLASFESDDGNIIATLFHPEVRDTIGGVEMMRRFLTNAGVSFSPEYGGDVALEEYTAQQEAVIAERLNSGARIEGFLSGGIDSMVAAALVVKVANKLGRLEQVRFTFVDNGHMRIEDEKVIEYAISQGMPIRKIDASERFFTEQIELINEETGEVFTAGPLTDESDPEIKRAIHGTIFAKIATEIIEETEAEFGEEVYFVQGSNESDAVSSGRGSSKKIKSHHNIKFMEPLRKAGRLFEPLLGLYKHHVRLLAETRYEMPEEIARRQPFPGVGESPRIVVNLFGELLPTDRAEQRKLDALIEEATDGQIKAFLIRSVAKYVGNKGDARCLGDGIFLEGQLSDWSVVDRASAVATDAFDDVTRTFYVPEGIEAIRGAVTRDNRKFTQILRENEELKRQLMLDYELDEYVSQHFVASLGVDLDGSRLPTLALRLFITGDHTDKILRRRTGKSYETFVDGKAASPGINIPAEPFKSLLGELQDKRLVHGRVVYDTTHKPPGSTELE